MIKFAAMKYEDKLYIDDFLSGNQLNGRLYQILLYLQDNSDDGRVCVRLQPKVIFNRAYEICEFIKDEKHPEELAKQLWNKSESQFLAPEVSVIFCCVYIILTFTGSANPNMVFFLTRIRQLIAPEYFRVFEPLLEEELYDFPELPKSFVRLKTAGDKIENLNERELYYTDYMTRYKQAKNKGNIVQQIADEISLIQKTKDLSGTPQDAQAQSTSPVKGTNKVKTVVIYELLKKLGKGKSQNDISKICRLVAYLTGGSEDGIYNDAINGILLTRYHKSEIDRVNQILEELDLGITIRKDISY